MLYISKLDTSEELTRALVPRTLMDGKTSFPLNIKDDDS